MAKTTMQTTEQTQCSFPLKINIIGINTVLKKGIIFNPDCKNWKCPHCAQKNAADWVFRCFRGASLFVEQGQDLRFVTLTSRAYATPNASLHYFGINWPRLARRAAYQTNKIDGQKWAYFLVPEQHKTGVLHAHIIATTHLKTRWFKDNAYKVGFGFMAKSIPIEEAALVTGYVTKYLGKSIEYTKWPKGFRRVRTSRNWPKNPAEIMPGWEWSNHDDESAWYEKYAMLDLGFEVNDKRDVASTT